jgi:hypothetical protein
MAGGSLLGMTATAALADSVGGCVLSASGNAIVIRDQSGGTTTLDRSWGAGGTATVGMCGIFQVEQPGDRGAWYVTDFEQTDADTALSNGDHEAGPSDPSRKGDDREHVCGCAMQATASPLDIS